MTTAQDAIIEYTKNVIRNSQPPIAATVGREIDVQPTTTYKKYVIIAKRVGESSTTSFVSSKHENSAIELFATRKLNKALIFDSAQQLDNFIKNPARNLSSLKNFMLYAAKIEVTYLVTLAK